MRVLFLCKRRYMGKDLLSDRYGRFFELPEMLARRGHTVLGQVIAYAGSDQDPRHELLTPAGVRWQSVDLLPRPVSALLCYRRFVDQAVNEFEPEAIVGASDAFQVIHAVALGRKYRIPVVADLYDHFHAYPATWVPGVRAGLRRALLAAGAVTCASPALLNWCAELRGSNAGVHLLPNGVAVGLFHPRGQAACRQELGLPQQALLIGTAGALMASRDIATLYRAFEALSREVADVHLVVAGRRDVEPPRGPNVRDLGELPHDKVPALFGALDIGVVCNADSLFARYCDPQKLAEMRACGLRAVVADTFGGTIRQEPGALWLYAPGDADGLARQLRGALSGCGTLTPPSGIAWADRALTLESVLRGTIQGQAGR